MIFAGFPPTIEFLITSLVTIDPAATTEPSPIFTPDVRIQFAPIQHLFL